MKLTFLFLLLLMTSTLADELRLVMWSFKIRGRGLEVPVELKTDYGYMVLNVGTSKKPKPHYILGDRKRGVVRHFKTKKEFLEALEKLKPEGELAHYTRCLIPSDYGLKKEDQPYQEIEAICKKRKIKLSGEDYTRCLCPDVPDSKR